jgi:lysylphosphatidylglycerol synthetase-like protein (DUF2156 family)
MDGSSAARWSTISLQGERTSLFIAEGYAFIVYGREVRDTY